MLGLCIILAGPTLGRTLAEFGADVIKIDNPGRGGPVARHNDINRRKRSILLDLARAHAHNMDKTKCQREHFGWICLRSPKRLRTANGNPSRTMLHELAHILTPNHWHDDVWRSKMKELRQPIPDQYRKRPRAKKPPQ